MTPEPTPVDEIIADNPKLGDLIHEDILDLAAVPLPIDAGTLEIKDCDNYLELNQAQMQFLIGQVPCEAFETLFLEASSMWDQNENYITGLKIYFAVDSASPQKISPVFQPLYLKRTTLDGSYTSTASAAGNYYILEEGVFTNITPEAYMELTENYKNEILIIHNGSIPPSFMQDVDVEAVIFPFQTIFTLIHDNPGLTGVFLYNAIRMVPIALEDRSKHCIILSHRNRDLLGDIRDKYANRSHLCPPDCNLLRYNVFQYR